MKRKNLIITITLIIVVGAGSFFGGMRYQSNRKPSFENGQFTLSQGGAFRQRLSSGRIDGQSMGVFRGEIINMDDDNMTVKLADGSTKIIILSGSTSYVKSDEAAKTDLKIGITVMVTGTTNSNGAITAQNIQLNPVGRIGGPVPTNGLPNQ